MTIIDPQQIAINTIHKNVAVNAGAGTGKTKVLTERYINILENGNLDEFKEIESIVAITFTKKATEEMIVRIRKEIKNNFHKGSQWTRYYRDLEKGNISTIHGFCGKILRENPIEANIDPIFQVLEDERATKLLKGSIISVLNHYLETEDEFIKLMKEFNVNRVENLIDDFYSAYNNIRTFGIDFRELQSITLGTINKLKYEKEDIREIKEIISYLGNTLPKNSNLCVMVNNQDPIWLKFYNEDYNKDEIYTIIEYLNSKLGNSTKETEKFNQLRSRINKVLKTKDLAIKWLFLFVSDLFISIDKEYERVKYKLEVLDYDDLQIKLLKLLDNDEIKKFYQNKFKYFMIDEFQDTNELQRKIFYKLTSKENTLDCSNLFIVGDPKQSIYGFRGSDIDVFYSTIEDIKKTTSDKPIGMNKNYRTKSTVLSFINSVFQSLMGENYDALLPDLIEQSIDVEVLENTDLLNYPELNNSENATLYEADLIAKRIKSLVNEGRYNYKDFALLFRATTRNYIYEEAFKNYNIPYFNTSGKRFFFKSEILDIINALKIISNPYDTISSIGFLRSPMIGLSDNCIYYLLKNKSENIYETIKNFQESRISKDDKQKLNDALDLLDYFYSIKDIKTITELTEEIIKKTLFIETALLKTKGGQSMANIYKFIDIVNTYELKNKNSLENFIDYIEEAKLANEPEANIGSEDSDVVKLLTIHKSKGLEFPVVIIPEMSKDSGGRFGNILFHKDYGLGIKASSSRGVYDEIKNILTIKDNEEKQRVLYVAMTRAKEMLIFGNQGKNTGFKKMIRELFQSDNHIHISNIDLVKEKTSNIRLINDKLIQQYDGDISSNIPLLVPALEKKQFETFSISQYLVFKHCERKYYMDYYYGKSHIYIAKKNVIESLEEPLNPIDKGNIIHKFAQLYNNGEDVVELLDNIMLPYRFKESPQIKENLMPYINNYLKFYREDYDQVFLEKPFNIKIGNSYLNGIIDRINIKGETLEIIDLKTNRVWDKSRLIEEYKPQLLIYAYAVSKILNKEVTKTSILFLESGESVEVSLDKEEIIKNIKNIEEFIHFVNNNSNINDYKKSSNCSLCKYKNICF